MKNNTIVVGIIEHNGEVVFILRLKDPFKGSLILPGGKVKEGESLDGALKREMFEETGINVNQCHKVGYYDETVYHDGEATHRHFIHLYHIPVDSLECRGSDEGEIHILSHEEILSRKREINPSDYRMLERVLFQGQRGFKAEIHVEEANGVYRIISENDLAD